MSNNIRVASPIEIATSAAKHELRNVLREEKSMKKKLANLRKIERRLFSASARCEILARNIAAKCKADEH